MKTLIKNGFVLLYDENGWRYEKKDILINGNRIEPAEIEAAVKASPRIQEILREYKLSGKVNISELEKLKTGHLQDTRITAAKIYSNLPGNLKQEVNPKELQEAAMFHDYGKVLIPENILNKNGELNEAEWAVMQQHSELGAELLKNKNLSFRAKELHVSSNYVGP